MSAFWEWLKSLFKAPKVQISLPEIEEIELPTKETPVPAKAWDGKVLNGIDLSHWETVEDWQKLKNSTDPKISFGITKLTQGTSFLDKKAREIVTGFQKVGIPAGVYLVNECAKDTKTQVEWFKTCLKGIPKTDIRHAIDFEGEVNGMHEADKTKLASNIARNKAKCLEMIRMFKKEFGHKPLFYCSTNSLRLLKFSDAEALEFDMWVANYGTEEKALTPVYGVKKYLIWQRTDKKDVPGVGPCDFNNLYGPVESLLIGGTSAPEPTIPKEVGSKKANFMNVMESLGYQSEGKYLLDFWSKKFPASNPRYYMVVDFSLPDVKKRAFLIDAMFSKVYPHRVSHGAGSDPNKDGKATDFSDKNGSHQTSLGVFRCAETYQGKHGYSCRLDGLQDSNDSARARDIVIHPADYVSDKDGVVSTGDSWGCFAFDPEKSKEIIDALEGGSPLYAFNG